MKGTVLLKLAILGLKVVQVHSEHLHVGLSILASRLFDACLCVCCCCEDSYDTRQFLIIFISVVATLREHLSSYSSQTSERCAHIYTVFFFKYTYTGKGVLGGGGGGR